MCFSAEADFVAAAAIAPVGVATLRRVRRPSELPIAALPILFAAHQLVEGIVWLGVQGEVSAGLQAAATRIYLLYAQPVLPALVPIGMLLLEPDRDRRRWLWPLVALGLAVGAWLLWVVAFHPVGVRELEHALAYRTHAQFGVVVAIGYVLATCVPALLSTRRWLRWFGVVNILGVAGAAIVREAALVSLWCVYAALASVLVLAHFVRQRRHEASQRGADPRDGGRSWLRLGEPKASRLT